MKTLLYVLLYIPLLVIDGVLALCEMPGAARRRRKMREQEDA